MKKIKYISGWLFTGIFCIGSLSAQPLTPKTADLLNRYYDISRALVNSNGTAAAEGAAELIKAINSYDGNTADAAKQKRVQDVLGQLLTKTGALGAEKNIARQREHFAGLSDLMISLAKEIKLSSEPVYIDYCPMKKSYWLSAEAAIKNPYYGNSMLTCGKVTGTLQ